MAEREQARASLILREPYNKSKLTPTGQRLCEFYQNSDGEGLPSKSVKSLPKIGEDLGVV